MRTVGRCRFRDHPRIALERTGRPLGFRPVSDSMLLAGGVRLRLSRRYRDRFEALIGRGL